MSATVYDSSVSFSTLIISVLTSLAVGALLACCFLRSGSSKEPPSRKRQRRSTIEADDEDQEVNPRHYPTLGIPLEPHFELILDLPGSKGLQFSNASQPIFFDHELCTGKLFLFHPAGPSSRTPGGLDFDEYFRGKTRRWELRVQFKFKRLPNPGEELFFGCELGGYVPMNASARRAIALAVAGMRQAIGGVYQTNGDDPASLPPGEEPEIPCCVLPLWAFDQFAITEPGETPPDLTDVNFPSIGTIRKGHLSQYMREMDDLVKTLDTKRTYTLGFWGNSRWLDIIDWQLRNVPLVSPFPFDTLLGPPPVYACLYCLSDFGLQPSGKDKKHMQSRKKYYFRAAIWSSNKRPERRIFEALAGVSADPAAVAGSKSGQRKGVEASTKRSFQDWLACCSGRPHG